jgi:hypothetical protein
VFSEGRHCGCGFLRLLSYRAGRNITTPGVLVEPYTRVLIELYCGRPRQSAMRVFGVSGSGPLAPTRPPQNHDINGVHPLAVLAANGCKTYLYACYHFSGYRWQRGLLPVATRTAVEALESRSLCITVVGCRSTYDQPVSDRHSSLGERTTAVTSDG